MSQVSASSTHPKVVGRQLDNRFFPLDNVVRVPDEFSIPHSKPPPPLDPDQALKVKSERTMTAAEWLKAEQQKVRRSPVLSLVIAVLFALRW
jgi:hypothetical protein